MSRKFWLNAHLVLALVTGIPVAVLGVTGAVLGLLPELQCRQHPEVCVLDEAGPRLPVPRVIGAMREAYPEARFLHVTVPREVRPWIGYVNEPTPSGGRRGFRLLVDPYTGRMAEAPAEGWLGLMERVHRDLGAGEWGSRLAGVSSGVLVILALTGLWLWWPMRGNTFRRLFRGRVSLGWHNLVGLVFFPIVLAMGVTGVFLTFGNPVTPALRATTGAEEPPDPPASRRPAPDAPSITLAEAVAAVQAAEPGATVTAFAEPGGAEGVFTVHLGRPGDVNHGGWERVWVDRYSGEVAGRLDTWSHSAASVWQSSWWALHGGEVFGRPARALWALASLSLAVLLPTGVWHWWRKRRRGGRRRGRSAARRRDAA